MVKKNNTTPIKTGFQYLIFYDEHMSAWLVDTHKGIKSEWGNVITGWKYMKPEELSEHANALKGFRLATEEETKVLLKHFGLVD